MKMKRSVLVGIVKEELARHLMELQAKPDDDPEFDASKKPGAHKGHKEPSGDKVPEKPKGKESSKAPAPKKGPELPPTEEPPDEKPEVPDEEDPADEEMPDDTGDDEQTGGVSDQVIGKTVQALTIEPKSKLLPGAKEIVVSFKETPDPLRILLTPTGQVKFVYRGKLSDIP